MKKFISVLVMLALCVTFASCSDKKEDEVNKENVTETETAPDETTKAAETEPVTTVEDTTAAPYVWQVDAINVMSEYDGTDAVYYVYDLNNDGVPEIIVNNGTISADTKYYLYDLQKDISSPIEFGSGNCVLCGYNGDVILQYCKMGFETVTKYSYDGEKLTDEVILKREVPENEDYLNFEALDSHVMNDQSTLSWTENSSDNNAEILASAK